MQDLIQQARELALEQIRIWKAPSISNFEISNRKGQELATILGADKDIVLLGTMLMDLRLGEALRNNRLDQHVDMSVKAARDFLATSGITDDAKDKILNCIAAHHGAVPYLCKEAEICANADCYRFLYPRQVFEFITDLTREGLSFDETMKLASEKLEEKYRLLSLERCKNELGPNYHSFKNLFRTCMETIHD